MRSFTSLRPHVLGVQHRPGPLDAVPVLGALVPGQFQHGVQPGADPGPLRALVAGPLQLLDLLERGLPHLLGEVGGLDAGPVVVGLLAVLLPVQLAQFLAHGLQLPPEQELPLLLVDAVLHVLGDGLGHVLLGEVVAERLDRELEAGDGVGGLQQFDLLVDRQERRVPGVVRQRGHPLDLLDPVHDLPGAALLEPAGGERLVLLDELGHGSRQRVRHVLVHGLALDPERGPGSGGAGADTDPAAAADERPGVPVGEPPHLFDRPEHTRRGVLPVDPRHEQHLGLPAARRGLGRLHGPAHLGVGQLQRNHHSGQHDLVVERQHGQGECDGRRSHDLLSGSEVELCRLNACAPPNVPQPPFAGGEQGWAGREARGGRSRGGRHTAEIRTSPEVVFAESREGAEGSAGRVMSRPPEVVETSTR